MIPEDHKEILVNDGISFLRSITEAYGSEKGMELWDRMCEVLDPDVKGQVFFAMLTGSHQGRLTIRGRSPAYQKVPAIKAIRAATGLGLKEAKDLADQLDYGQHVTLKLYDARRYNEARSELIAAGCLV